MHGGVVKIKRDLGRGRFYAIGSSWPRHGHHRVTVGRLVATSEAAPVDLETLAESQPPRSIIDAVGRLLDHGRGNIDRAVWMYGGTLYLDELLPGDDD